jgi:hypothetical protein
MDGSAWPAKCLLIHLRNGEAVKVKALLKPRFGPKAKFQPWIVEELNEALANATISAPLTLLNVERARVVSYRYGCSRWSRFSSLSGRSVNSSTHSDRLPVAEVLHVLMLPDLFFNFHPTC